MLASEHGLARVSPPLLPFAVTHKLHNPGFSRRFCVFSSSRIRVRLGKAAKWQNKKEMKKKKIRVGLEGIRIQVSGFCVAADIFSFVIIFIILFWGCERRKSLECLLRKNVTLASQGRN